ncbi:thermonuclease family protein [uncultured Algoriphagus sp.]|uniref:thermonuclease family protein n=1 Tax=uncultured Algoriphagus sp. TaxID=417365 RepID=UPI0030EE28B1|tara:strand:+ start:904 stop:1434 length:531 start_codon:yes stop_codon:yes gene_type:complete
MKISVKSKNAILTLIGIGLFFAFSHLYPEHINEVSGKVVAVQDGDTVTILTDENKSVKVRLSQIDAPEKNQPFGQSSKQILSDLVYLKEVSVIEDDVDRYGRVVATLYLNDQDINAQMVQKGAAWVYTQYVYDHNLYLLQDEAKLEKRGLWALPEKDQIPPWKWRKKKKTTTPTLE